MARTKTSITRSVADAGATRAVEHWTSRVAPLTAVPAGALAEAGAIVAMHDVWGGSATATPFYAAGMTVCGVAATGYTWLAAGGHRHHLRALGTATAGAASAAAVVGMIDGFAGPIGGAYAVGSLALSTLWGIRHVMKSADEGGQPGDLGKIIDAEKHHIFNLRRSGKGTVTATVQAKPGATVEELQGSLGTLAAATGIPRGAAVLRLDDDNSSLGYLEITVADLLKATIGWPGLPQVGGLCTDPIPLGRYANGDEFEGYPLTADGDVEHCLIIGTTGSGKSEFCLVYMGTQCTRRQVSCIGVDITKGLQTFGPIAHGLSRNGLLVTTERDARKLIKALAGPVCKARTAYLTSEGMTKWAPRTPRGTKTKINLLDVWIEEAADLADGETYAEMCRRVRSAGIILRSSMQRASWTNMSTDARAFHGGAIAFGVRDEEDARFALPDHVVDAGAAPTWRNTKPGYHYCCALRASEDKWTTRLRSYYVYDRRQLADAVTRAADVVDPMDPITAKALGSLWDKRTVYLAPTGLTVLATPEQQKEQQMHDDTPVPAGDQPAEVEAPRPGGPAITPDRVAALTAAALGDGNADSTEEASDAELEMTDAHRGELDEAAEEILGDLDQARRTIIDEALAGNVTFDPADEYDDAEDRLDQEGPGASDITLDFGDSADDSTVTPEEARRRLDTQLDTWLRGGKDTFSPVELTPLRKKLGRGRRWFFHQRDRLVADGVIAEGDAVGEYQIIRSPFVGAEAGDQ